LIGNWSIFGEIGRLSSIEEPFKTWPLRGFSYPLRGCHCFWFYLVAVVAVTLTIQMYRLQSISIPCALVLRIKRISTFPQTRLSQLWILHGPWLSVIITPCFQYVIAARAASPHMFFINSQNKFRMPRNMYCKRHTCCFETQSTYTDK